MRRGLQGHVLVLALVGASLALAGCQGSGRSAYRPPRQQQPILVDSLSPRTCSSSTMGGNLIAVCDPVLLEKAWENHTLTQPGTLDVEIAGRKVRVGGNPGLTQVVPADGIGSLGVPTRVTLKGTATDRAYLYLHALSEEPEHWASGEALFRRLGLARGGTATIAVKLSAGKVVFTLRRPDGSVQRPLRWSHLEGPGVRARLAELPNHYADNPTQGVRTYLAALNAHDGKTICRLWTPDVRARFTVRNHPCWTTVTGLIGYGGESDSRLFERAELVDVEKSFERTRYGVTFTAVPVSIRSRYRRSRYSPAIEIGDQKWILWFRRTSDGWRIAKDLFSADSEDAYVPPDPYAALHARQAREREDAVRRAARERSLIRLERAVSCPHPVVSAREPVGDVQVSNRDPSRSTRAIRGRADIIAASVALHGRRVCFSSTFAGPPLRDMESIGFTVLYTPSDQSQRASATFQIDNDAAGVHAGLTHYSSGPGVLLPDGSRVAVKGKTIRGSFTLPSRFPSLRADQFSRVGLRVSASARVGHPTAVTVSDQAEGGVTPEKLAAEAAKAAQAREARQKAASWAPALVRYRSGSVGCRGRPVTATDSAGDARGIEPGRKGVVSSTLAAMADIRIATLAVTGRHVCFSVTFARQPFGRDQRRYAVSFGMGLTYSTKTKPFLQGTGFGVQTNSYLQNGLTYAGFNLGSGAPPRSSNAHAELHGNTLTVDFELEQTFPYLRPRDLSKFSWGVGIFVTDLTALHGGRGHAQAHDQLPNNPDRTGNSTSPEIRQSDGKVITPY
jgi:hypothetical protein